MGCQKYPMSSSTYRPYGLYKDANYGYSLSLGNAMENVDLWLDYSGQHSLPKASYQGLSFDLPL